MVLFLQFTITDTRRFSDFYSELLDKPRWPSPKPFSEFVRTTGNIVERNKGGIPSWVGENFVCKIGKAIQFPEKILFANGAKATNISKHLYAGRHYTMTKYEFVFNIKTDNADKNITYNFIKNTIHELLNVSVKLKLNGKLEEIVLNKLPSFLRYFHHQNTTIKFSNKTSRGIENIISCTPQCYFYLERNEWAEGLQRNFRHIHNIANAAQLYGAWYNHKNSPFRIWIHHRKSKSASTTVNRELRMTILRLHSEYECLRNVLWGISNGLISVEQFSNQSSDLQNYFNIAIKTFLFREKNLEYQSYTQKFFDYFSKIFAKASPGDLERLYNQIEVFNFRPNIIKKINIYVTKNEFMSTKFENHNSNIFSQGDNNEIHDNTVTQNVSSNSENIDFEQLSREVSHVLEKARSEATTTEQLKSVIALSEIKDATEKNDSSGVIKALKSCGKFALDVANKFAASMLVELIKSNSGL